MPVKRRLHIQFILQFGIVFGPNIFPLCSKKFGTKFGTNILIHRGTIFGQNKIPNCWTNSMCRRRLKVWKDIDRLIMDARIPIKDNLYSFTYQCLTSVIIWLSGVYTLNLFNDLDSYLGQILSPYEAKYFGKIFSQTFLLHRGTIFGPNKIPNRLTNWLCTIPKLISCCNTVIPA